MNNSKDDSIPFSEFKNLISDGTIKKVELGETYFLGYTEDSSSAPMENGIVTSLITSTRSS